MKRLLGLVKQHMIISRPFRRWKNSSTIEVKICFRPKHRKYSRDINKCSVGKFYSQPITVYFGMSASVT